ncbi:hypothetical protein KQH40_00720 [bacterium]|nr:hypothetical protein [bacterium]
MAMKTIHGMEQLVQLGKGLLENESLPCVLVAPDLLKYVVQQVEVVIDQAEVQGVPDVTEFLPTPRKVNLFSTGIEREYDPIIKTHYYADIVDGYVACGVTRVSPDEFDAAKSHVESEHFDQGVEISRFADGDLLRIFVHGTDYGPGVVIDVLTEKILPDVTPPRIAINPFRTNGWKYMTSLFESGGFFWAFTDGRQAFILASVQDYYPRLVQQAHTLCVKLNRGITARNWSLALNQIRGQLKNGD